MDTRINRSREMEAQQEVDTVKILRTVEIIKNSLDNTIMPGGYPAVVMRYCTAAVGRMLPSPSGYTPYFFVHACRM